MALIEIQNVGKTFKKKGLRSLHVLEEVDFNLHAGEVIALLGKSGSGKSTLLRIIAGLIKPSAGQVLYRGEPVDGPVPGLTMVFQHFALLPWLTVLENVELGLAALGVGRDERRQRALKAIDIVGLDGFESAYPKELSGGMSQRVGLARALVVEPEVLLMDEPFSALDVLTAENLRGDLLNILKDKDTKIKTVLLVTHNIEEAAMLADRILVFSTNPGQVSAEIDVTLPHPRSVQDTAFHALVDEVYGLMTQPSLEGGLAGLRHKTIDRAYRLPNVGVSEITGLIETIAHEYHGAIDLPELAEALHLAVDDLFPITEALEIMRFAKVSTGDIQLTTIGVSLAEADILQRKHIFAKQLMHYVPLARHIRHILDQRSDHREKAGYFLSELTDYLSEQAALEVLRILIDWARYAEIFAYDVHAEVLSLENPS
jgi:NitT/TauT family transport system ATP-binding protein